LDAAHYRDPLRPLTKTELYEAFEPPLNAGEIELPDIPKLQEQLLTLVIRGAHIDHQPGDHDDWPNACCGAVYLVLAPVYAAPVPVFGSYGRGPSNYLGQSGCAAQPDSAVYEATPQGFWKMIDDLHAQAKG
jgi:hypothetical protein